MPSIHRLALLQRGAAASSYNMNDIPDVFLWVSPDSFCGGAGDAG